MCRNNSEKITALHYLVPQFKKDADLLSSQICIHFFFHFFLPKSISSLNVICKSFNFPIFLFYLKNSVCPTELMEGIPWKAIMDNDDFKEDTLTGISFSKNNFLSIFLL